MGISGTDRLRQRRPTITSQLSAEDVFDVECSTLPLAAREALIGPLDSVDIDTNESDSELPAPDMHSDQHPHLQHHHQHHHQSPHPHNHHHHHHHHDHDHYEHPHPDDIAADSAADASEVDAQLRAIGAKTPIVPVQSIGTDFSFKRRVVWSNAFGFLVLHLLALYGVVLTFTAAPKWQTTVYSTLLIYLSGLGVTMGAHRLWSHRSFKARLPLKVFLLWLHTLAGQNCLYVWVRDHRQHHKYSDTDADPHNANRGFFFSHIGWLMSRKHPKVIEYGNKIDMSDLEADAWIMFQKRHYKLMYMIFSLLLPTSVPVLAWGEDPWIALFTAFFARVVIQLNATWLVNSAAHLYGTRPFDKTILPVESMFVAFLAVGEGWHNYHHAFPWDYRASELGTPLNVTGYLIDILASLGFVYDRKAASHSVVRGRIQRTGDLSHKVHGTPEGRSAFRTWFNLWRHPSNPTYTSVHRPQPQLAPVAAVPAINDAADQLAESAPLEMAALPLIVAGTAAISSGCTLMDKLTALIAPTEPEEFECGGGGANKSELNVDEVMLVKLG